MVEAAILMIWFSYVGVIWAFIGGAAWLLVFYLALPLIARRNSGPPLMAHLAVRKGLAQAPTTPAAPRAPLYWPEAAAA